MEKYIIIHYAEIGLKGKNRPFFENKLIKNIRAKLSQYKIDYIKNIFGRILIKINLKGRDIQIAINILSKISGIKYFAFTQISPKEIDKVLANSLNLLKKFKFNTFKIYTKRAGKDYPLNSRQINEKVGEHILDNIRGIKVKLDNPEVTLFLEVVNQYVFLYLEKLGGIGGLPVGTSGKVLSLISSGIDSPVASYRMMKRGASVFFLHFHSYPQTSRESINNVKELVLKLNHYQINSKIYFVPFLEFQKEVVEKANARDRVILYRRMMIRTAELIGKKEKINTLVTGESLGQVASQTLENMLVIGAACENTQVFRPLICYDKEEIIKEAKQIGTYDISSLGDEDCCSLFVPANPNTKSNIVEVETQEKKLEIKRHLRSMEKNWEIIIIN